MKEKLLKYQEEAVDFLLKNNKAILRLDTGLGKTRTSIELAKKLFWMRAKAQRQDKSFRVLVIAPAFLIPNWRKEINKWHGDYLGFCLISYTKAAKLNNLAELRKFKWDLVICDEAHYLKNWGAKRTQNIIKKLLVREERVVFSTATPYVRSAEDLHPLYSVCQPGEWGALGTFREKYCNWKPNPFARNKHARIWYGTKKESAEELKNRGSLITFSRSKAEVAKYLPEKVCVDTEIEVAADYHLNELRTTSVNERGELISSLDSKLSTYNKELGLEKAKHFFSFIEGVSDESFVVFCKHKDVATKLQIGLKERYNQTIGLITGDTHVSVRETTVDDLWKGRIKVLVATIGAAGVGINLQCCSTAIFVELPWSYAELKQTEDRIHRLGSETKVMIHRLVAKDTIDELIISQINQKLSGEEATIGVM